MCQFELALRTTGTFDGGQDIFGFVILTSLCCNQAMKGQLVRAIYRGGQCWLAKVKFVRNRLGGLFQMCGMKSDVFPNKTRDEVVTVVKPRSQVECYRYASRLARLLQKV